MPDWVVVDPGDLVVGEDLEEEEKDVEGGASDDDEESSREMAARGVRSPQQQQQRTVEKGKARAESPGSMLQVKARLSDSSADVVFQLGSRLPVSVALQLVQQASGKVVRLMYLGKSLREDKTLLEQGWQRGHVLNAMVVERDASKA